MGANSGGASEIGWVARGSGPDSEAEGRSGVRSDAGAQGSDLDDDLVSPATLSAREPVLRAPNRSGRPTLNIDFLAKVVCVEGLL